VGSELNRRELLLAGAALAVGAAAAGADAAAPVLRRTDFATLPAGDGWGDGWRCPAVANLVVGDGIGRLEAGSDVFPDDPRPVAFAVDCRFVSGSVRAVIAAAGSMAGVVLRRTSPRDYYAAVFDVEQSLLAIVRRSGNDLVTLAQTSAVAVPGDLVLELAADGSRPTALTAKLTAGGVPLVLGAHDDHPPLQRPGDPGVLSRARTLFPSAGPSAFPALGNLHLLPYGVQEGEAVLATPVGAAVIAEIRRESTVAFREISISSGEPPRRTIPSVIAATTGLPRAGGARLHVASDVPARVDIELSRTPGFERPRRIAAGRTGAFDATELRAHGLKPGRRAYWRATLRRAGTRHVGPVRSFRVLPGRGDPRRVRLAIAACGTQFGPIFDHLADAHPDVFVWQGDLNYPDTHGPVAQTMSGYAGIWRDFLANPRLAPVLERTAFVAQRDDHDYAAQDSNSTTIPSHPWGVAPWDSLMGDGIGVRFAAGLADVWVLDQRRFKSDPTLPDTQAKTLLGDRQRAWLLDGLASSRAPFKVICSPCTVFMHANARDGNWATGYTAERDALLTHLDRSVSGRVVFVTGDTHLTGVYDAGGRFEARPCPIDIPVPNDITLSDPRAAQKLRASPGVSYADDRGHFAVVEVSGHRHSARLDIWLVREDGLVAYRRRFTQPLRPAA
jgi:PhoD-like phosphatase